MSLVGSSGYQLVQKQKILMKHLTNWKDLSYNSLRRRMMNIRNSLERVQKELAGQGDNLGSTCQEVRENGNFGELGGIREHWNVINLKKKDKSLRAELDKLMEDEELFWAQRAKQRWLDLGNRNTRYFHKMATISVVIVLFALKTIGAALLRIPLKS